MADDPHSHHHFVARAEEVLDTDPELAMRLLDALPDVPSRRADPGAHGRAAFVRALITRDRGRYELALDTLRAARHDLIAAGLTVRALATELGRASIIREAGDAQRSVDIITDVIERLAKSTVEPDEQTLLTSLRAQAREQLAEGLAALGDNTGAITQYDLAWNSFHALGDRARRARVEGNRAVAYLNQRMLHRALGDLEHARHVLQDLGHHATAARFAVPTARTLAQLGRLDEAASMLEDARRFFAEQDAAPQLAAIHLAASEILLRAGRGYDARVEAEMAIDLFVQLGRVDGSAEARYIVGMAHWMSGQVDAAAAQFDVAERLFAHQRNAAGSAHVAIAQAIVAWAAPSGADRAAELATDAVRLARSSGDDVLTARALLLVACAAVDAGSAESALGEAETMIDALEIDGLDLQLDFARSRLHRIHGDLEAAAARLRNALARHRKQDSGHTPSARTVTHPRMITYAEDELVDVLLEIGTHGATNEAWRTTSARRASALIARRPVPTSVDHETHNQALSDAIDQVVNQSGKLDVEGAAAHRLAHFMERQHRTPASTTSDGRDLPVPDGPQVEYHVVHDHVVVFVIRDGLIQARRLSAATTEIADRLNEWYTECSIIASLDRHDRTTFAAHVDSDALRLLSTILIDPIADLIDDLIGSELVVVPHRQLRGVPFEALRLNGRALYTAFGLRFSSGLHAPVSLAPEDRLAATEGSTLVLLNPDAQAPRIADEADQIRRVRPEATVLVGPAASSIVLANLAASHDIVHIACHGFFWPDHPSWSALKLGDRWVSAAELASIDLNGCLVIVNACASGQGRDTATETVGLVWALLAAGCRGVVCTTWPVDDDVALAFTTEFHALLAGGLSPAEAVRRANHAIARSNLAHPWAWAAYRYIDAGMPGIGESVTSLPRH